MAFGTSVSPSALTTKSGKVRPKKTKGQGSPFGEKANDPHRFGSASLPKKRNSQGTKSKKHSFHS